MNLDNSIFQSNRIGTLLRKCNASKENGPIPEYTNHTEQKIVEYLREKFKDNPNVSGKVEIISERVFCDNCKALVDMFEHEFPNMDVTRVEVLK